MFNKVSIEKNAISNKNYFPRKDGTGASDWLLVLGKKSMICKIDK